MPTPDEIRERLRLYYAHDAVRARIVEFLGGTFLEQGTCEYVLGSPTAAFSTATPRPRSAVLESFEQGEDIARALWDHKRLLAHLDVEYVNGEFVAEPYLDPRRTFQLQIPVVRAIEKILLGVGISPLHQLTGRGHHFVWSVAQDSDTFRRLAALGPVSEGMLQMYAQPHPPHGHAIRAELARAFAGLGLLMEYLAHLIQREAGAETQVPIQLTDVEVGSGERGRESIVIDISEYADPLHTRVIRVPFSVYLKPQGMAGALSEEMIRAVPLMFQIPMFEISETEAIEVMRSADLTAELASRAAVRIPDQSGPVGVLLERYQSSPLAAFHGRFYSQEQHPPERWPETYDRLDLHELPNCVRDILENPNDRLLKPAGIQLVVRVLMALGWHPRHVAGLIRSKYERDFHWGTRWLRYNAACRADAYTRLFAGQIATGADSLIDFNCVSNREKGYCGHHNCEHNLADYRDLLLSRI
ncbi:hypothetical protein [Candidatus Laterigemmans baculatus]|uniref:hypothetical protein n=1 Tax=Candidatus Laterigemmans baculatus TaxID=2770505 RepID=UPI0013DCE6B4|nr:hypothetical protein [Candidatus Laterigemmans baculatus]